MPDGGHYTRHRTRPKHHGNGTTNISPEPQEFFGCVTNCRNVMQPSVSLPCSQHFCAALFPEPDESSLLPPCLYRVSHPVYTGCPTRYRTRHFFNNSNSNEDIATKFEQEYVRCVRNEKECVCSAYNCCDKAQRSAS